MCVDAVAAAEYILATGDTRNPITQREMDVVELRRLDKITRGTCESVLDNLRQSKTRALQELERTQLCQAMETEPAELWSYVMGAPFTLTPHPVMMELPFIVATYATLLREYSSVSALRANEFHTDNVRNLTHLNIKCGDAVLYEHIITLLEEADITAMLQLPAVENVYDVETEDYDDDDEEDDDDDEDEVVEVFDVEDDEDEVVEVVDVEEDDDEDARPRKQPRVN